MEFAPWLRTPCRRTASRSSSPRRSSRSSSASCAPRARCCPRTRLIEHVWDFAYDGDSNVVEVYVRYLREKVDRPVRAGLDRDRARHGIPAPRDGAREPPHPRPPHARLRRGDGRGRGRPRGVPLLARGARPDGLGGPGPPEPRADRGRRPPGGAAGPVRVRPALVDVDEAFAQVLDPRAGCRATGVRGDANAPLSPAALASITRPGSHRCTVPQRSARTRPPAGGAGHGVRAHGSLVVVGRDAGRPPRRPGAPDRRRWRSAGRSWLP